MIIDQAMFQLHPQADASPGVVAVGATNGVVETEMEFSERLLATGIQLDPACRLSVCRAPSGRYTFLYLEEGASEVRALFLDEQVFAAFDGQPFRTLDYVLEHLGQNGLAPIVVGSLPNSQPDHGLEIATSLWTADVLSGLLDCMLADGRLGILTAGDARCLVTALYQLVPRSCRLELSFNGLTLSFRDYPFQICLACDSENAWESMTSMPDVSVVNLDDDHSMQVNLRHSWSQLMSRLLNQLGCQACSKFVESVPSDSTFSNLSALAQASLAQSDVRCGEAPENITHAMVDHSGYCFQQDVHQPYQDQRSQQEFGNHQQLAMPKLDLGQQDILEQLDQLDDAVFDAIAGLNEGYARLETLWPQIRAHLASELVEESRDQYVRLIVDRCVQQLAAEGSMDESTAKPAMDVLRLLFDNAST